MGNSETCAATKPFTAQQPPEPSLSDLELGELTLVGIPAHNK